MTILPIRKRKKELILVTAIIIISIIISIIPTFYNIFRTPQNTVYSLAYNFIPDYYQFISFMKDGENGQFALTSRFTPEVFPRKFGHIFFPVLGFLGSRMDLSLFTTFTLARVFFGIIRLAAIYCLISSLTKNMKRRISMFLTIIVLPSFLDVKFIQNHLDLKFFLPGITNFDVFRRITFLPHHLFASFLTILAFLIFTSALKNNKKIYSLFAGILLMIASVVNPATILNMLMILAFAFILLWIVIFRKKFLYLLQHFLITVIPLGVMILYFKYYLFTVFPWNNFYKGEITAPRIWSLISYLGALGLALPLSAIGLFGKKPVNKTLFIMIISWAFAPIVGFIFIMKLSFVSPFRIFQAQQFIPLGVLASYGIFYIKEKLKSKLAIFVLMLLIAIFSLPYYYVSVSEQLTEVSANGYNVFIPKDTIQTFRYLDKNTPKESVVMTGYFTGQMLPAFTHNRVFAGHGDGTYNYEKKLDQLRIFYSGNQGIPYVQDLLKQSNISYILFTPDAPNPSGHIISTLPNVKLIYEKGNNYLYQIIK